MTVHQRGSETILLAEDERMVRELVEEVLRGAGYRVLTAADGAEAVEVFEQNKTDIDLVLLDIIMPRMNGPRAFEHIVAMRPDVRFLFTSGYTNVSLPDGSQIDQDVEVLRKPYHPETLLLRLREILDSPLPHQDAAASS